MESHMILALVTDIATGLCRSIVQVLYLYKDYLYEPLFFKVLIFYDVNMTTDLRSKPSFTVFPGDYCIWHFVTLVP